MATATTVSTQDEVPTPTSDLTRERFIGLGLMIIGVAVWVAIAALPSRPLSPAFAMAGFVFLFAGARRVQRQG